MKPLHEFCLIHYQQKAQGDTQRLGQRFVNLYIKSPWPELFFEEDDKKAVELIKSWLTQYQYTDTLPPKLKE